MSDSTECTYNSDPWKLVREGTSQEQRLSPALVPSYAPVDEHTVAHRIVFAQAYSAYLEYYNSNNAVEGDWQPFFSNDVSAMLAIAAVRDVDYYKSCIKEYSDFLKNLHDKSDKQEAKKYLGYLFSCTGTLAQQLDVLKEGLPEEIRLRASLHNMIQSQLAPAFRRLIAYYKADLREPDRLVADTHPGIVILSRTTTPFSDIYRNGLSKDWIIGNSSGWGSYAGSITEDYTVYGSVSSALKRINHIATHNLFTSIFDQFLKAYARTVREAGQSLEETFTAWDRHEPHYTLFLAFLRLFEYSRADINTLTGRHLDFYYREILRLKEKNAEPGKVHLLVELTVHTPAHLLKTGELFKAGKDSLGKDVFFTNDRDFVANQAKVAALKTIYRHGGEKGGASEYDKKHGRLYASQIANSDDGLGAELTSPDQSWHPFHNKIYREGVLSEIKMPKAEIGFAIASHYLLMAGGRREVKVQFTTEPPFAWLTDNHNDDVVCLFTGEKGWIEKNASAFISEGGGLKLSITLDGADPAVTPYTAKTHGYDFATGLPVLLVKLRHLDAHEYIYSQVQDLVISQIELTVNVERLKDLAVSNDFGPADTSKPFQPFGPSPVTGARFIVGSKEVFQKDLTSASLELEWQSTPNYYISNVKGVKTIVPVLMVSYLEAGKWGDPKGDYQITTEKYDLNIADAIATKIKSVDFSGNEPYSLASRNGYMQFVLEGDLGLKQYQIDLVNYLAKIEPKPASHPGPLISGPFANAISMTYGAKQTIPLNSSVEEVYGKRSGLFFHLAPFGQAEQHPFLNSVKKVFLLPQFDFQGNNGREESEAEFYIGVAGLKPPQSLALLFQVADGTADPLSENPDVNWSYLRNNEWISFDKNAVSDQTGGLINSGIITFTMPHEASADNTLLPSGMHWIRAVVECNSDAVCRLRMVAAQSLEATFADKGNDPSFSSKVLEAGTISKLNQPDAAIKKITQPFESFGGRGKEAPTAFYTRISERLRHKDRAIALWDYERLVLEAFPQIYRVKCLNHTQYEPNGSGKGIYRELAPGHVTIVTIPNQQFHNLRDPLRPFTSLGLLEEIGNFLSKRLSCFVNLHVKNPEFEELRIKCKVHLYDGCDETFYVKKMQETITRFLSPWAFPGGGSPSFGGKIYKSSLINFVEDLQYVDYVTEFRLFHTFKDTNGESKTVEKDEVEGSKAVSVLVSARNHIIEIFKPAEEKTAAGKCPCEV